MSVNKVDKTTGNTTLIAGSTLWADSPIGTILAYGGATAPSGWFLCQGQAISRTTYSELFAVIGTSFGTGDGSTTFNLPDLREATTKGVGLTGKSNNHYDSDGVALGEFVEDRIKAHKHDIKDNTSSSSRAVPTTYSPPNGTSAFKPARSNEVSDYSIEATETGSATNEVKAVGVNYIIKAKMVAMPSDFMSKVDEAVEEVVDDMIPSGGKKIIAEKGYSTTDAIDLDTLKKAGFYSVTSQYATNLPDNSFLAWWQIIVINKSTTNTGYATQLAISKNNMFYIRDCEADVWTSWQKVVMLSDLKSVVASSNSYSDFKSNIAAM